MVRGGGGPTASTLALPLHRSPTASTLALPLGPTASTVGAAGLGGGLGGGSSLPSSSTWLGRYMVLG